MEKSLLVVDDDLIDGERTAAPLLEGGWDVSVVRPSTEGVVDSIAAGHPLAAIFCLRCGDPHEVERIATEVLADPRVLRPLMVFVAGDPDAVVRMKAAIPVGVFIREEELSWVLKHLSFKF